MEILLNHIAYLRSHLDSFQYTEQPELIKKKLKIQVIFKLSVQ